MQAAPARPTPRTILQPDGTTLTVRLHGDEWCHWTTDMDGHLMVRDAAGYYRKATVTQQAEWEVSKAKMLEKRALVNAQRVAKLRARHAAPAVCTADSDSVAYGPDSLVCNGTLDSHFSFPSTGKVRGLVVLVEFQDVRFTVENPHQEYSNMMMQDGYDHAAFEGSKYKHIGSAHDYFYQNSFGLFDPQFDVYGPILLKDSVKHYGQTIVEGGSENVDAYAWQMITEACDYLNDSLGVDFSQYDMDEDGVIDFVYAIYAGHGENATDIEDEIWPHAWDVHSASGQWFKYDDKYLSDYACSNELIDKYMDGIGTFCHEFSHVLGLPDLYNTNGSHDPITPWTFDVLDYGCYNHNSYVPAGYSSYERYELGWTVPTVLSEQKTDTLPDFGTTNQVYIVPVTEGLKDPREGEYYLFENRQQNRWDEYIPGHGMLIWHIDFSYSRWALNVVNNWANHQCIDLVEAGEISYSGGYNVPNAATPFPGTSGKTEFTQDTAPAFCGWTKPRSSSAEMTVPLYKSITNITEVPNVDETGTELGPDLITFDFTRQPAAGIERVEADETQRSMTSRKVIVDGRVRIENEGGAWSLWGSKLRGVKKE